MVKWPALALMAASGMLPAQVSEKTPLTNAGTPMRIEFRCTDEDMDILGLACPPEAPCDAFLELSAVETIGARLFLIGNVHTDAVTLHSVLLATPDAGKTWNEPSERIRGAALDQIQILDNQTGWIGGQIVQPLPRDPFLLKTADGGLTWRRYPVLSESRAGAVDRFRFQSRKDGLIWIDRGFSGDTEARYERYESSTGGESWTLRQATGSQPPREAAQAAKDTGWRLRPDAASKAYRLERDTEGQWRAVASFLIPVGQCKELPKVLPEPPPEPAPEAPKKPPAKKSEPRR